MKKIIRLTESDLRRIVRESVERILGEGAFDKYPGEDQMNIALDRNMNTERDTGFAHAYAMGDPIVKNMKGSTMRHMMSDTMGNNIHQGGDSIGNVKW